MTQDYKKGSFLRRLAACIIDAIIVVLPVYIITWIVIILTNFSIFLPLFLIADAIYFVYFDVHSGSTVGMRLLHLKVVNNSYENVSLKSALIRETVGKYLTWLTLGIGFLLILVDKNRRSLFDLIASTYVVATDEKLDLIVEQTEKTSVVNYIIFALISIPLFIFGSALGLYFSIGIPVGVYTSSMEPNFKPGQIVAMKYPYLLGRSDVVFYRGTIDGKPGILMGRIIAVPTETILLKNNEIIVNGKPLNQSKVIKSGTKTSPGEYLREGTTYTVPATGPIVMGDNRENTIDSRNFGPVPRSAIIGKVVSSN